MPATPPNSSIDLNTLLELSRLLANPNSLDSLLQRLAEAARQLTHSQAASILVFEAETGLLRFAAAPASQRQPLKRARVPLDNSVAGAAYRNRQPVIVNDAINEPLIFREVDDLLNFETRSLLAVPLLWAEDCLGVMEAVNKQDDAHYTGEDVAILEILASFASSAISNASLAREVESAQQDIQSLEKLKSDFIAIASHELRTPLGLVMGHAAILKEMLADPQAATQLDGILEGASRLEKIANDLSHLDNSYASHSSLDRIPTDMRKLVKETCQGFEQTARQKGVSLGTQISRSELVVHADPEKIALVIGNLVDNAIRFTPPKGHVLVAVERLPTGSVEAIKVSVMDDGIGIPARELPRVFDRFYQVESHATRQHGGLGLGLPVAKIMVEQHGGQIWAESIEGRGSKFSFLLPIHPPP